MSGHQTSDYLIVGGGIAGAAAGYFLSEHGTVTLLEAEESTGTHATGRSSALFSEYYGNTAVRVMTAVSREFYEHPPTGFGGPVDAPALLIKRGVLALETPGTSEAFDAARAGGAEAPQPAVTLDQREARALFPPLRAEAFERALYKPGACDIDVHATQQGFLRGIRSAGGSVITRAQVRGLTRRAGEWRVVTDAGRCRARTVVNAAGAWADRIAETAGRAPLGLVPLRRTAALVRVPEEHDARHWPMVTDVADTFYAKPEAGGLLLSPVDAEPVASEVAAHVRPRDLDVALAIDRFQRVADLPMRHVIRAWAGLRTAPPDDTPVIGHDPELPDFLWLAGLGGYGIQTAPAAGRLLAAVAGRERPPTALAPVVACVTPARDCGHAR